MVKCRARQGVVEGRGGGTFHYADEGNTLNCITREQGTPLEQGNNWLKTGAGRSLCKQFRCQRDCNVEAHPGTKGLEPKAVE